MNLSFLHIDSPVVFPAEAARFSVALLKQDANWELEFELEVPPTLAGAAPKRRRDYLAGRYCVRQALRSLAPELAEAPVPIGGGREPVWPNGIVGSITHTDGFASAVVARSSALSAVGLDSERERPTDAMTSVERHILSPREMATLRAAGVPARLCTLLVFSAKESVFKCLYPSARQLWEFHEVEVECVDVIQGTFVARGVSARAATAWPDRGVEGRFVLRDGCVHTSAFVPAASETLR